MSGWTASWGKRQLRRRDLTYLGSRRMLRPAVKRFGPVGTGRRRGDSMKKLLLLLPVVLVLLSTSTVSASGKPERIPAPIPQPLVVSGSCSFDVDVKVVKNNEYFINFYDANGNLVRQLVGGSLVLTLTNLSNHHSITVNVSGPAYATFNADGSYILKYEGLSGIFFPNLFILTSGRVDVEYFPDADPVILR